jgi:membrane protein implicated in regulation of membrane protease activity
MGATLIEVKAHGPIAVKVLFPLVMLAYLYFLLQGIRWLWIATIAVGVLGLVLEVISGSLDWQGVIWSLLDFTLLLLPVTRRYFQDRTAAVSV